MADWPNGRNGGEAGRIGKNARLKANNCDTLAKTTGTDSPRRGERWRGGILTWLEIGGLVRHPMAECGQYGPNGPKWAHLAAIIGADVRADHGPDGA